MAVRLAEGTADWLPGRRQGCTADTPALDFTQLNPSSAGHFDRWEIAVCTLFVQQCGCTILSGPATNFGSGRKKLLSAINAMTSVLRIDSMERFDNRGRWGRGEWIR
jgi:hypothetical protein